MISKDKIFEMLKDSNTENIIKKISNEIPATNRNEGDPILPMIIEIFKSRIERGKKKYGGELRVDSGRNPMLDLTQEMFDALMYSIQTIMCQQEIIDDQRKVIEELKEEKKRRKGGPELCL